MKRLVIIGDNHVEYRLVSEIHNSWGYRLHLLLRPWSGSKGYAAKARGTRKHKIEVIATPELAEKILEHVAKHYFDNYAMIAFIHDVEVLRGDKFVAHLISRSLKKNQGETFQS